jgi:hypothetical protein
MTMTHGPAIAGFEPDDTSLFFASINPYEQYGVHPAEPDIWKLYGDAAGLARSAGPGTLDAQHAPLWSPHNPLFWFGGLLLATFGLIGASVSVGGRAGPVRGRTSVSVGKKAKP